MIAILSKIGYPRTRVIAHGDQRFEFDAYWGAALADLLDQEFPKCGDCEDRNGVCWKCDMCVDCDGHAPYCSEDEDEDADDPEEGDPE